MFRVGQRVVCVDARPGRIVRCKRLVKNNIYTIVDFDNYGMPHAELGLILAECRLDAYRSDGSELGWWSERFRPVVERKTDISVFQKLLQPKPEKVE